MTYEEKFRAGRVLYKDENGQYVLELWGGSTKHPDSIFFMRDFEFPAWANHENPKDVESQLFPWLLECASRLEMPIHSYSLAKWAISEFEKWAVT